MKNNIRLMCSKCSDRKRIEFQKTLSIKDLEKIQKLVNEQKKVFVKIPFVETVEKYCNPETQSYFYYNDYNENIEQEVEHMWVYCKDVNIENQTIGGFLSNDPCFITDLKYGDIVIVKFKDIEDIIYPETQMN